MKNVEPKMLSVIVKLALTYSNAWRAVKIIARTTVKIIPHTASILLPAVMA
jgi:hypothetical protein